jgi:hypothetical protein
MKHTTDRTDRAARWIADLTNPSVLSVLLLLLIAFLKSHRPQDAAVWMGVIFALYILIPVGYVYFRMRASGIPSKSIFVLITFLKKHPRDILILSVVLGIPCLVLLILLKAPGILLAPVAALLAGSIVTAMFNTFYRVSYHLDRVDNPGNNDRPHLGRDISVTGDNSSLGFLGKIAYPRAYGAAASGRYGGCGGGLSGRTAVLRLMLEITASAPSLFSGRGQSRSGLDRKRVTGDCRRRSKPNRIDRCSL